MAYSTIPRDQYGQITGIPTGITPKRITATGYYAETPDASVTTTDGDIYIWGTSPKLKNTVKWSEVRNGSSQIISRSEIGYDDALNTGNPTQTRVWDSVKQATLQNPDGNGNRLDTGNSVITSAAYNSYGSPPSTTDARGVTNTITYGCINGQTSCQSTEQNLYPTKTEVASNYSGLKRTSTAEYDFSTRLVTKATDVDNDVSTEIEYDDAGRPTKAMAAVGKLLEAWTQTVYDDQARRIIVKSDLETKGDAKRVVVQFFDQIGRVRLSKTLEDAATQSATNETDNIKVQTRYLATGTCTIDATKTCSFQLVSNPYRANYSYNTGTEPSMGWTLSHTINSGRHSETKLFSGAALPKPFVASNENQNSTGVVKTDIDVDRTLVTDQAGKQRISKTNALGQLTDVWEITASDSSTVSVSFPGQTLAAGYQTSYEYDTLNNLKTVTQDSQTRTFTYSSLSRLLSATNPEIGTTPTNGTINYQYDDNGNLTYKTEWIF